MQVLVMLENGELSYEPVTAMVHRNPRQVARFVQLTTASNRTITLTPLHYTIVGIVQLTTASNRTITLTPLHYTIVGIVQLTTDSNRTIKGCHILKLCLL